MPGFEFDNYKGGNWSMMTYPCGLDGGAPNSALGIQNWGTGRLQEMCRVPSSYKKIFLTVWRCQEAGVMQLDSSPHNHCHCISPLQWTDQYSQDCPFLPRNGQVSSILRWFLINVHQTGVPRLLEEGCLCADNSRKRYTLFGASAWMCSSHYLLSIIRGVYYITGNDVSFSQKRIIYKQVMKK